MDRLLVMLLVLLAAATVNATNLSRNPFKPLLARPGPVAPGGASTAVAASPLKLRGILTGGTEPLVNLGGHIIAIGEEAEGYRLVSVMEEQAVFVREGEYVIMHVYDDEAQDD